MTDVIAPPRRLRRGRPEWLRGPSLIGVAVIVLWVLVALTVPWWTPYDPLEAVAPRLQGPSFSHLMGTDQLGRDVFTRTLWGARTSLPVAFIVIISSVLIGTVVGAIAGVAEDRLQVALREPLRGVAPGQTLVLYRPDSSGDEVIGSATLVTTPR